MNKAEKISLGLTAALNTQQIALEDEMWEVIVRYNGSLNELAEELNARVEILSPNYAILTLNRYNIPLLVNYRQIEYVEEPKLLQFMLDTALSAACIEPVKNRIPSGYDGKGILIAIIDSGIDYTHRDFSDENGSRILYLWDQTLDGNPPTGFYEGTEFNKTQLDEALASQSPLDIAAHMDAAGHGTHVAGIAAGNGRASSGRYTGVASGSSLLIIKLGETGRLSFARSTEIMRAVKYAIDKAIELNMPLVINLSYGTNDGPHTGNTLFEGYLDDVSNTWKCAICAASGNEGASGRHFEGRAVNGETIQAEFSVGGEASLSMRMWKNFTDEISFELISPDGSSTSIINSFSESYSFNLSNTSIFIGFSQPRPYDIQQEVLFEFSANNGRLSEGVWRLEITGRNVLEGNFNIWLPVSELTGRNTAFLRPSVNITLTIPSTAANVITVGGYNSLTNSSADFSGRGFTADGAVKPDICAPAVGVTSPAVGGGYDSLSGTSFAAPFVTGACAILMQWGIIEGNDRFLYGQRLKAYLRLGARRQEVFSYPNNIWGYGTLCLERTLTYLIRDKPATLRAMQNSASTEDAIYSNDYLDLVIEYNDSVRRFIEDNESVRVCNILQDRYVIINIQRGDYERLMQLGGRNLISLEPFLMGLTDSAALTASGITAVQNQPYLGLRGQGILIGIVDTGIDYKNPAFIYEDGTSKIYSIWDQTIRGNAPEGFCYGVEYTQEQINEALSAEESYNIVQTTDESGHGTALASICASRELNDINFIGAAPDSEIIVVKLKGAKPYLRQQKFIPENVYAYESSDLMQGIEYIMAAANRARRPVSICLGLGTNEGGHSGNSYLEEYVSLAASRTGVCISCAVGNEANKQHHAMINFERSNTSKDIELRISENESGVPVYIWSYLPDEISISITSPLGEKVERIYSSSNYYQSFNLTLGNTIVQIQIYLPVLNEYSQLIIVNLVRPSPGTWKITIYSEINLIGYVHAWLPMDGFVNKDTIFLTPEPMYTITLPSTSRRVMSVGGYNQLDGSIYVGSGRGPTRLGVLTPYFCAPAVGVEALNMRGLTSLTGTSAAAAITAGAAALMLEWGFVRGNDYSLNTTRIITNFIRGTNQRENEIYPNNIWGFGTLDLYATFQSI